MDLSSAVWRKSSRSGENGGNCVEVAAVWRKSSRSGENGGMCVQVARLPHVVAVRDSKNPDGPALLLTPEAWRRFTAQLKHDLV
jgi:hypothetical protein